MKAAFKRLVCSVLLVMVLISSVPAAALDIDFGQIDWGVVGGMFGIPEDQLDDLEQLVSNLDEESLDKIVSEALDGMLGGTSSGESEESGTPGEESGEESGETSTPGPIIPIPVIKNYVAVIGGSGLKAFYPSINDAIANASKSEVIFVIDERGLDSTVATSCQIIFNKGVDTTDLVVAQDYAIIKGSYTFGSSAYELYMISKVSSALESAANDLNGINDGYSASFGGNVDDYTLTLTINASDVQDLASGANATVNAIAEAIMPAFPLFGNIVLDGNELYDGTHFEMTALDTFVNKILTDKRADGGIYQMAFDANSNTLYTFPMTMDYQDGKYTVEMDVVVKVNATESELSSLKSAMRKAYARVDIEAAGGVYDIDVNAIGFFRALAEKGDLISAYDIVTEDGLRAVLDDVKIEWICKAIMAYDAEPYADVAAKLQNLVGRFMKSEEYANGKDNYLGDFYAGNGVYEFSFDFTYNYSSMLEKVAESTASFGYDYAKLLDMCKNDTNIVRTFNFAITAYKTTRLESANDVIEGVLDALDAVSGETAYVIEREYTDGIITGLNFVIQPGSAVEMIDVATKQAAWDVLTSIVPVCLAFEEAEINGNVVFDRGSSIAWKDVLLELYGDYADTLNFTYIAELQDKTVLTFDLHVGTGDVCLDIPVAITLGVSDDNFAKLQKIAAKLAEVVDVEGDLVANGDGISASVDVTIDLRDDLDLILSFVALDGMDDSYAAMRMKLHEMTLQDVLDSITLDKLQQVAEKAGYSDQFNALVVKLANRFGLDTTAPCNYKDLIAVLDANHYYQTYIKERLESKLEGLDLDAILSKKIGDFYRNDGTYYASLGEKHDGVIAGDYIDRVLDALLARFNGEYADKLESALANLGYDSIEELADAIKNRYSKYYYANYDLDVSVTVLLFHVYNVTFIDVDFVNGEKVLTVLDEQLVVAGDNAEFLLDYHGGPFSYIWEGELANVTEDREIYIYRHYDADGNLLDADWIDVKVTDPTCTEPGTELPYCTECGKEFADFAQEIPAPGHDWGEWIETTPATCYSYSVETRECNVCHETEDRDGTVLAEHTFGDWIDDPENTATCEDAGKEIRECGVCHLTESRDKAALGHAWGNWAIDTEFKPTCLEKVREVRECGTCGDIEYRDTAENGEHEYELKETIPATCTNGAYEIYLCKHCHDIWVKYPDAAPGHNPVEIGRVNPTCKDMGSITFECTVCGEIYTIELPVSDHTNISIVVTEPTCENPGSIDKFCNDCEQTIENVDVLTALGHNYGTPVYTWVKDGDTYVCTATVTCLNGANVCENYELGVVADVSVDENSSYAADCQNDGLTVYVADFSGSEYSQYFTTQTYEVVESKTGHDGEWTTTRFASCTVSTIVEKHCKVCGELLDINDLNDAWGHEWIDEWFVETPASCTETGVEERYCANGCGEKQTREITATGHEWLDNWTVTTPAGCTETGVEERSCANECGEKQTREIVATGHDWSAEWTVVTPADCTNTGVEERACANNCGEKQTREIAATGHAWPTDWTVVTPAGCTETGLEERTCANECGEKQTREIAATGHVWPTDWTVVTPAGCTETGLEERTCANNCGEKQTREIAATGHKWPAEWTVTTPAGCTSSGEEKRVCENGCGEEQTRELLATGHDWTDWTVTTEATCTTDGVETRICNTCKIDETRPVPKVAHNLGDWTSTKDATCSEDGEKSKFCTECGNAVETETIPATGIHTAGDWEVSVEASCTVNGERVKRCTSGGEILDSEVIPATGHDYVTTETEGVDCHTPYTREVKCSNCGDVKEKSVNNVNYPPLKKDANDVAFLSGVMVVKIEKMTVETFKSNFYCDITVYDNSGKELSDADYVGTNDTFVCNVCEKSFTIAVIGDINGDGVVNTIDYMMIKRYVLGTFDLVGASLAAADVNVDLSADAIDYMMVKMYVLGKYDFYNNVPDWDEISKLIVELQ